MTQPKTTKTNELHDLGYKIFLDRYAQKDMTRETLAVGDIVIVVVNPQTGQREIGTVTAMDLPKVTVLLKDGETVERDLEHVDKPLETEPSQMMDRVAKGIAAIEKDDATRNKWTEEFRWLLDDWKFVPGGRILTAAGTDQELTFYNCMPPEQEILTSDGYKPIGDVRVGDLVVTHKNRLRKVLHKFERETEEPLYSIKVTGLANHALRITGEHKILAVTTQSIVSELDTLATNQEPQWIQAQELKQGDYLAIIESIEVKNAVEIEILELANAYAPELSYASPVVMPRIGAEDKLRWIQIDSIKLESYKGKVLDIEVEEDHSFISADVVVSNCYVVPSPRDSRGGIMDTLTHMTEIMSRGGGVGINISSLRPRHAYVKGVNGRSSGSVSWGALYSFVTGLIEQGGSRRGALMLILNDWHPDVFDFINSKRQMGQITNANISVGLSDKFMEAVEKDADWDLVFPDTSEPDYDEAWDGDLEKWAASGRKVLHYKTIKAKELWNAIIESAWASAEPGVWFRERSNKMANSWYFNPLISTNPCTTGDTLVATEYGYTKARDLQVGMKIRTPAGLKPIEKVYNNGVQKIWRVEFTDGGHLECTADHKLKVVRDKKFAWVAVQDLRDGDRVQVMANEAFGSRRRLPDAALKYIEKRQLNVPDYFDRNLGFMMGVVTGDGTLRQVPNRGSHGYQCRVAFGANEQTWLELFQENLTGMGIHSHVTLVSKDIPQADGTVVAHQAISLECYKLSTLLAKLGMPTNLKAPEKKIAEEFLTLDRDFIAGLLDGLFSTDGGVDMNPSNPMLRFHTSSYELAQQVRLMLLQFGIHGRIYASERAKELTYDGRSMYGTGIKYDVIIMNEGIPRFYSEIGISHPEKAAKVKDIAENYYFMGGTWLASVVSVEDTGREEEVFDVYEPETVTWITNGYVSFDCGEQPLGAWSVCNLGALNLANFYDDVAHDVDWKKLDRAVRIATRFLDNVIDSTPYFFEENYKMQMSERRVGLGTMGIAELMIYCGVRYGSEESVEFIDKVYKAIAVSAYETSIEIAAEKGAFPQFDAEKLLQSGFMAQMPEHIKEGVKANGLRNVTLLTQAPTGCVAPDTLVSTADGLTPIVEMGNPEGAQWQIMPRDVHTDEGLRKASHFYINGHHPVKQIRTERGFTITATHNHRLRVIDADGNYVWRCMDELTLGDKMVLKRGTLDSNTLVSLKAVDKAANSKSELPSHLSTDFAELLGLYMGDGYTKERGGLHIVVAEKDPDLLDYVMGIMQKVWGSRHLGIEERIGCWTVNLTGYYIPRFFEANGFAKPKGNEGQGAAGAFVPSKILQAGRDVVAAFLRGLFEADGSVHRGTITLVSTSQKLIQQVQVALLGLGIVATIRQMPEQETHYGERALFELRILNRREAQRFVEIVGFISERKRKLAADLGTVSDRGDNVDVMPLLQEFYAQSKGLPNQVRQTITQRVSNGALTQQFVKEQVAAYPVLQDSRLAKLVDMDVFVDEIAEIVDGFSDTFDISVPDNHTYIANGFVSHNTTGTMVNTSTGIEPFFSWVYYRKSRLGLHEEKVPVVARYFEENPTETELPEYFVTAMELAPEEHVKVQGAFQKWIDSAISKTCNVPNEYTVEQVSELYKQMYALGCKGGTIYRDGSRDEQVLMLKGDKRAEDEMKDVKGKQEEKVEKPETVTTPHRVYPRPSILNGTTVRFNTPFGKSYITMNSDEFGNPFEVFITVGKAGSDIQADAEALGRMISLQLRTTAPQNRREMLKLVVEQLQDIGGARPVGFGPNRILSLPDAVGRALMTHYINTEEPPKQLGLPINGGTLAPDKIETRHEEAHEEHKGFVSGADMCPDCGTISLIRTEGCRKCLTCGYSEC